MILDLVIKLLFWGCAFAAVIMFLPGNILLDINPTAFRELLPKSLNKYTSIESINVSHFQQIGPILGPESIAYYQGKLVTGSADGYLYEITSDDNFKPLIQVFDSKKCQKLNEFDRQLEGSKCGRPLGLKFDSKGVLFVIEPSIGVYKIDNVFNHQPKVSLVFSIEQTSSLGKASVFLDDIAIEEKASNGHILYISDVSSKFTMEEATLVLFGSDKGRILRYDTDNNELSVVADNLFFPNGVEVATNQEAVLFAEFASRVIWRYNLKGARKGKLEKIATQLPAEIDNIRVSSSGKSYWVAMLQPRTLKQPTDFDYYIRKPLLRKLMARTGQLFGCVLTRVGELFNKKEWIELGYSLKTMNIFLTTMLSGNGGMLLEIDLQGNILSSIYSNQTDLSYISEVREVRSSVAGQRILYLGSFLQPYLRKIVYYQ